ncbi:AAA family ATPase [Cruoricaptor ignavus]|uniref:AAA family ATPase n=1 Tax=Cruoricaptor ignavus TaxID=1118202 RepID=UPI00370D0E2F
MKTIYLKSLSLRNFKGVKKLDLSFDNHETNIHGANGTGKTTVFDAFTWVLFGKDSSDRKDFNIKTLNPDGTNVEKTEHTVTAVLSVDGEEKTLQRIYKENWVKKRGEADAELKGHETLYYINDVPKKAGEYAAEISEIVDESVFKLITNPQYFPAMKWQNQREILFKIAGTVSDQEIASGNREFEKLLEKLNGKKLSDYKTQIAATKRKLKTDLEAIPTRVDEAQAAKPEYYDFEEIKQTIKAKETEIAGIEQSMLNKNTHIQSLTKKNQQIYEEINTLRADQQAVVTAKQKELYNQDAKIRSEKNELIRHINSSDHSRKSQEQRLNDNLREIESIEKALSELRNRFDEEEAKEYQAEAGKLICPVWNFPCGERHQENQDKARQTFNTKKVEKLAEINSEGKRLKAKIDEIREQNSDINYDLGKLNEEKAELEKKLLLYPSDSATVREVSPKNIPEWNTLESKIAELQKGIITDFSDEGTGQLAEEKKKLAEEIKELQQKLSHKAIIEQQDNRIAQLNSELKNIAQQISNLEKDEFTLEAFTRAKIDEAENRINSRFSFVKFKLFDRQINGADVETCQAMVNGVPYSDANTASKINAGIDIINVLCDFNDVTAPIFIDNRESISEILETESQIVNLIVNPEFTKLTLK